MNSLFTIKQLTSIQWQALLPIMILAFTGIVTLITSTFEKAKSYGLNFILFFVGLLLSAFTFIWMMPTTSPFSILDGVLFIDSYTQIFAVSMIAITLLISIVEFQTPQDYRMPTEVYPLLCFSLVGAIILSSSTDLMMLIIAMELMTYSVYVMVTMNRTSKFSAEAGLKYFILGCTASAVLLYGVTLIFGSTGSFNLSAIGELLKGGLEFNYVLSFGFLLFFLGTLFKVGSSPLHVWVPDVYTGAANTITSFMMTIIKFASFAFLIRVFLSLEASGITQYQDKLYYLFLVGSILSLLSGNLVGLLQSDFKRLLSYSSIGHTGFILIGLVCAMKGITSGYQIAISYLLYYMVASVGIMAVIKVVNPDNTHSFELKDFEGLYKRSPFLAVAATLFLLSLAGFPPLAGFFGKYFIIIASLEASEYALAVVAIISSIIGMAMYLKPVKIIFFSNENAEVSRTQCPQGLTLLTIWVCLILSFILPYFI